VSWLPGKLYMFLLFQFATKVADEARAKQRVEAAGGSFKVGAHGASDEDSDNDDPMVTSLDKDVNNGGFKHKKVRLQIFSCEHGVLRRL
jgi:hypothetical protein